MIDGANQKRGVGRPRKFPKGSTTVITVSIEKHQKEWLDQIVQSEPSESASKIVREALNLWKDVHIDGKTIEPFGRARYLFNEDVQLVQAWKENEGDAASAENGESAPRVVRSDDNDDYDYSWK